MVVLTVLTYKNGETIYFEDPIPRVHFMKLISCSLFNSWDTLKKKVQPPWEIKTKMKLYQLVNYPQDITI